MSGGNNDIGRMQEIKDRSMMYERLQHYFIVNFPQKAGSLREFLYEVLGLTDDITRFEYTKKNNKSSGPAPVWHRIEAARRLRAADRKNTGKASAMSKSIKMKGSFIC